VIARLTSATSLRDTVTAPLVEPRCRQVVIDLDLG
jgi:hypothetical protein